MSYVTPQTKIFILKDVPLDNTYQHTLFFSSKEAQISYFSGLVKYSYVNCTYQRVKRSACRVEINSENLYDCNYIMFQNTAFGDKWFYAFITEVEYVNNVTSEITFEIDVMQSWFFDYTLDYCFVEREHSSTDNIGEHIEPEGVNVGEYVYNDYAQLGSITTPMAVIVMINDTTETPDGTLYDGVYGGSTLFAYNADDVESIKAKLGEYVQASDSIVSMYMCPAVAVGKAIPDGGMKLILSKSAFTAKYEANTIDVNTTLNGYKPKNKKMLTYPYNFFSVNNASGSEVKLRYEFFDGLLPKFKMYFNITQPVKVVLRPTNYKGSGDNVYTSESITLENYPMCSWSTDSFRAWVAQNAIPITAGAITGLAGLALGAPLGVTAEIGAVSGMPLGSLVRNTLKEGYQASIAADKGGGSLNNGNANVSAGLQNFYGGRMSCTAEYARMIDDFFTMFGYVTKRNKIPNRNVRPHWTYTKTMGCTVTGSVPAPDMNKICSIYDNGITFWKKGSEVGNYSLDNTV